MSALPPKADMFSVKIDVCFVPKADLSVLGVGALSGRLESSAEANQRLVADA